MSVPHANVNVLMDTTQSFVDKVNRLTYSYSTEALTANSTLGVTGSPGSPRNARLIGSFYANSMIGTVLRTEVGSFQANSSHLNVHGLAVIASGTQGLDGQVMTSSGPGQPVRWTSISGVGTVTSITAGSGLSGGTITSSGSISVNVGEGLYVTSGGAVAVSASFVAGLQNPNASTLLNKTWAAPDNIGVNTPAAGRFTSLTATQSFTIGTLSINDQAFVLRGIVDATTVDGNPGLRVRATSTGGDAVVQFTNNSASSTGQISTIAVNQSNRAAYYSNQWRSRSLAVGSGAYNDGEGNIDATGAITSGGQIRSNNSFYTTGTFRADSSGSVGGTFSAGGFSTGGNISATGSIGAGGAITSSSSITGNGEVRSNSLITCGGDIRASGNVSGYYSSDRRLKDNIRVVPAALEKLHRIGGYTFDWTNDVIKSRGGEDGYFVRKHDVGVIAQEILNVLPEAVAEREDGTLAVRYESIIPLLIEGIKELSAEVQVLRERLDRGN